MKLLTALLFGLFLLLAGSEANAQLPPTQCVTTVAASGTGDAIQLPQLPCWPTTTLIVLKTVAANLTNSPTITVTGSYPAPVVNFDLTPITVGEFQPNQYRLMSYNGANWIVMSQAESSIAGLVSVPNNSALKSLSTTTVSAVVRLGFYTAGDAPSLSYVAGGSACSLNSGAGDNGSQVQSADGKCWLASFPDGGVDVREWGVLFDNTTDNTTTLTSALTWAVLGNRLILPAATKTANFASPVSVSLAALSMTVSGAGADASMLEYTGASGVALTITYGGFASSTHLRDFSLLTTHAGGATGIGLTQIGTIPDPAVSALSDVSGVTFRGADGYSVAEYWSSGLTVNYVSNINFTGDIFAGATASGIGINLIGQAGSRYGVAYNVAGTTFLGNQYGIYYGSYIQGVTVNQSNFDGNVDGIHIPSGGTGQYMLTVTGSQFGSNHNGINDQYGTTGVLVSDNLFLMDTGECGVCFLIGDQFSVMANTFAGNGSFTGTAVSVNATSGGSGSIIGNTMTNLASGISIGSSTSGITVSGNSIALTTAPMFNANITGANFIHGLNVGNVVPVTGAADNGSGTMRLTVANTGIFINGQVVMFANVNGTSIPTGSASLHIIDGTHMDLLNVGFGGSYTGNGEVFITQ